MLKLFIKSAFRNFSRNKIFVLINLLGLSLGVASSLLIFIVVRYDLSFDRYHTNYDNIYRLNLYSMRPTGVFHTPACPAPAAEAMKEEFPEVESAALLRYPGQGVIYLTSGEEEKLFEEEDGIAVADSELFQVFDFEWITAGEGNLLDEPNKVLLTRKMAYKYFGVNDPSEAVGQIIRYNDAYSLEVAGVLEDIPDHTDLPFQVIISAKTLEEGPPEWMRIESDMQLYVLFNEAIDITTMDERINEMVVRQTSERYASRIELHLQPLSTVHYDERFGNYNERTVSVQTLWAMGLIGGILLLTACINFINLATAQSLKRAREVGIRKVMGSDRSTIILQMIAECSLLVLAATIIGFAGAYSFLPAATNMLNLTLDQSYFLEPVVLVFALLMGAFMVLVAGFYPGWVLSSFDPIKTLKGKLTGNYGTGMWIRRILVVFQFASSQALIIGTIVVSAQMDFFQNRDLGFNKESILTVGLPDGFTESDALISEWGNLAAVSKITLQTAAPSSPNRWMTGYTFPGADPNDRYFAEMKMGDQHYLDTYELELLAGRNYHRMDTAGEVLINEKMAFEMGFETPADAIGNRVEVHQGMSSYIVGVVRDFNTVSLQEEIIPVAVTPSAAYYNEVGIKIQTNQLAETIASLESVWYEVLPEEQFNYEFLDESLARFYENEQRVASIFNTVTLIAIFIGCLGLYGLITFMTNNRLKEVGIRKTLGAGTGNIVRLFSSEFVRLILVAFLLAGPIGYYYMDAWLQGFAFRINLEPWMFVAAVATSLLIALLTIGYRSYRAALTNPVNTLRYE